MADDMALGGGGRFKKCVAAAKKRGIAKPEGFCAAKGKAKYGKAGFQALSEHGTGGAAAARAGEKAQKGG